MAGPHKVCSLSASDVPPLFTDTLGLTIILSDVPHNKYGCIYLLQIWLTSGLMLFNAHFFEVVAGKFFRPKQQESIRVSQLWGKCHGNCPNNQL